MTNGEFVSRVVNDGRFLTKDEHISKRFVLHVGRTKSETYMAHKLADNTLFEETNLVTHIPCFLMNNVSTIECGIPELSNCRELSRSVNKLPELFSARWGDSIISVTTVDNMKSFTRINPSQYGVINKRRYSNSFGKNFRFVKDGYLYVTSHIKAVNVSLITLRPEDASGLSDCEECDKCKSLWDFDFVCSNKILEPVIRETIGEVMQYYRQIQPDENPNMSENQKDRTIN